jgi:hypothetical protein
VCCVPAGQDFALACLLGPASCRALLSARPGIDISLSALHEKLGAVIPLPGNAYVKNKCNTCHLHRCSSPTGASTQPLLSGHRPPTLTAAAPPFPPLPPPAKTRASRQVSDAAATSRALCHVDDLPGHRVPLHPALDIVIRVAQAPVGAPRRVHLHLVQALGSLRRVRARQLRVVLGGRGDESRLAC